MIKVIKVNPATDKSVLLDILKQRYVGRKFTHVDTDKYEPGPEGEPFEIEYTVHYKINKINYIGNRGFFEVHVSYIKDPEWRLAIALKIGRLLNYYNKEETYITFKKSIIHNIKRYWFRNGSANRI